MLLIGYIIKCDDVWTPNVTLPNPGETAAATAARANQFLDDMNVMWPGHRRELVPLYVDDMEVEIW